MTKKWETYEQVAQYLLNKFRDHFELESVEGKQKIKGLRSGTDWEIDAKGVKAGQDEMFVIVECRRNISCRQKQEHLAGLAYRIIDVDATGGIIVSPLPLQKGAKKVAQSEDIVEVTLNKNCSTTEFFMRFLERIMVGTGVSLEIPALPSISVRTIVTESKKTNDAQ